MESWADNIEIWGRATTKGAEQFRLVLWKDCCSKLDAITPQQETHQAKSPSELRGRISLYQQIWTVQGLTAQRQYRYRRRTGFRLQTAQKCALPQTRFQERKRYGFVDQLNRTCAVISRTGYKTNSTKSAKRSITSIRFTRHLSHREETSNLISL